MGKLKLFFKQLFCKHQNRAEFVKHGQLLNLSGERRTIVCTDCDKEIGSYFAKYEGMGFK